MIVPKRIKYLGINLAKEAKDLYTENWKKHYCKKVDINGKISYVHGLENIIKMSVLPKAIHSSTTVPMKVPMAFFFFYRNRRTHPKFYMKFQK